MGDRHRKYSAHLELIGKRRVLVLDAEIHVPANEMQTSISHQRARQQAALAQNLESVADPKHKLTFGRKILDRLHHRRKMCKRSCTQIITVRKAPRQDDSVKAAEIGLLVPDEINRLTKMLRHRMICVVIAIGTRENYYSEFHLFVRGSLMVDRF